jgi:hypothetical protein
MQLHLYTGATEEYDGTSWTAGGNVATARRFLAGGGVQTAAVIFGGIKLGSPQKQITQKNTMVQLGLASNNLNTARTGLGGCGTQTAALAFGGNTPPVTGATESYDGTAWTTIPATLNTARERVTLGPVQEHKRLLYYLVVLLAQLIQQQQKNGQVQEQLLQKQLQ